MNNELQVNSRTVLANNVYREYERRIITEIRIDPSIGMTGRFALKETLVRGVCPFCGKNTKGLKVTGLGKAATQCCDREFFSEKDMVLENILISVVYAELLNFEFGKEIKTTIAKPLKEKDERDKVKKMGYDFPKSYGVNPVSNATCSVNTTGASNTASSIAQAATVADARKWVNYEYDGTIGDYKLSNKVVSSTNTRSSDVIARGARGSCGVGVGSCAVVTINENANGGKMMKNIMGEFKFGPVQNNMFKMSLNGIAFANGAGYSVYDKDKNDVTDVTDFCFDMPNMIYMMPIAIAKIEEDDIILHKGMPMVVKSIKGNELTVIDPRSSEVKVIMPLKNMFGFNYCTKIVSLIDFKNLSANEDSPFGNMLPLMMMQNSKDMNPMMMMMLMKDGDSDFMSEDMMMMMAMSGGNTDMNSMLPFMMMSKSKKKSK